VQRFKYSLCRIIANIFLQGHLSKLHGELNLVSRIELKAVVITLSNEGFFCKLIL